jgi:phage-related holin
MFRYVAEPWRLLSLVIQNYVRKIFIENWHYKVILAPLGGVYNELFSGDWYIALFFFVLFFIDLFVGIASALKRKVFTMARFDMWVIKLVVYCVCIIVVGLINGAIARSWGINFPILDTVLIIMMASEAISIFANFQELTGMVPPVLLRVAEKVQANANRRLEDMLKDKPEGDRRRARDDQS